MQAVPVLHILLSVRDPGSIIERRAVQVNLPSLRSSLLAVMDTTYEWPSNITLLEGFKPFFYSITDSNSDARYWLRETVKLGSEFSETQSGAALADQGSHLVS